jgi:hypothetical protein
VVLVVYPLITYNWNCSTQQKLTSTGTWILRQYVRLQHLFQRCCGRVWAEPQKLWRWHEYNPGKIDGPIGPEIRTSSVLHRWNLCPLWPLGLWKRKHQATQDNSNGCVKMQMDPPLNWQFDSESRSTNWVEKIFQTPNSQGRAVNFSTMTLCASK